MKNKIIPIIKYILVFIPFILVLYTVATSLDWGVPNQEINNIITKKSEKKDLIDKLINISNKSLKTRDTFVIEDKNEYNLYNSKLRIVRRYLMYSENPDEMLTIAGLSGINPKKFQFKPKNFQYGGGYLYPVGAMIALGRFINNKNLNISLNEICENSGNMASIYIWGRALNIFALLICFLGFYLIFYSNSFSKKSAIFVSGIIMSSPVIINWATILKPHLLGASFFILSVGIILLGREKKQLKKYFYYSMISAGFASSAQYLMVCAGIIPCLFLLQNKDFSNIKKSNTITFGIILSGITFFIFNPYHIFNMDTVLNDLSRASSFYTPDFFNVTIPFFALWMWGIGSGFLVVPFILGLFYKFNIKSFSKKYNYLIITIIIFGYYGSVMCISTGYQAIMAKFFIPMILLLTILFLLKLNSNKNIFHKKCFYFLLFIASLGNIFLMKKILNEGGMKTRPYIEASKFLDKISENYSVIYQLDDTPAPYKYPAFNIDSNIKKWNNSIKKNEILVTNRTISNFKLLKEFKSKYRYFKMSFAEKDFFFYINPIKSNIK